MERKYLDKDIESVRKLRELPHKESDKDVLERELRERMNMTKCSFKHSEHASFDRDR